MLKNLHLACEETKTEHPEHVIGELMAALAYSEGHRPKHQHTLANGVPEPSPHRKTLRAFFDKHRGPLTTTMISKNCGVPTDSVRDLCKSFTQQGWLSGIQSTKGYTWQVVSNAVIPAE